MEHVNAVGVHVPYPRPSPLGMLRVVAQVAPYSPVVSIEVNRSLPKQPEAIGRAIVHDRYTSAASCFKGKFWQPGWFGSGIVE